MASAVKNGAFTTRVSLLQRQRGPDDLLCMYTLRMYAVQIDVCIHFLALFSGPVLLSVLAASSQ